LIAARELGELSLADALSLCLLFAEVAPERYSPAAARFHARFVLKAQGLSLEQSQLALSALAMLPQERGAALRMLVVWLRAEVFTSGRGSAPLPSLP
jgi:hypothetical protein